MHPSILNKLANFTLIRVLLFVCCVLLWKSESGIHKFFGMREVGDPEAKPFGSNKHQLVTFNFNTEFC